MRHAKKKRNETTNTIRHLLLGNSTDTPQSHCDPQWEGGMILCTVLPSVMLRHRWLDLGQFQFFHTDVFKQTSLFEHSSLATDARGGIGTPVSFASLS